MKKVPSALDRWICQLMFFSEILPLSLWLPTCHTQMEILTILLKYRFIVAYTKNLHGDYFFVCAISSLLHTYFVTSNACTCFLISLFYLPIYIQSMFLTFIDNASTYSYSFNYQTNMHPSQHNPFKLLISTYFLFSETL